MITCQFENGNSSKLRHVTVDTLVLKENKILLEKRAAKILEGNKWALIGGFVERDETLKQAVEREVFEESGYNLRKITLLTIRDNPDRPKEDRQNISFVFLGEADKKTGKSDWEVKELKWFDLSDLPAKEEFAFDHYEDILFYLDHLEKHTELPIW